MDWMAKSMIITSIQMFIRWLNAFSLIVFQQSNHYFESLSFKDVDRFSMIEAYTLSKTVQAFHSYKFEPIEITFIDGLVRVVFMDEKAHISYMLQQPLFAELNYDLVFDSALNYAFIELDEASWIDKQGD